MFLVGAQLGIQTNEFVFKNKSGEKHLPIVFPAGGRKRVKRKRNRIRTSGKFEERLISQMKLDSTSFNLDR